MTYQEIIERELNESETLAGVIERLKRVEGERVLLFVHDDPDGTTSAAIIMRALSKLGASEIEVVLPPGFDIEKSEVEAVVEEKGRFDLLICVDKGSSYKADLLAEVIPDTIVIDHHFLQGEVKKALLYNPLLTKRGFCSGSYICHMVATLLGTADEADDFDALVGLKADFPIDPAAGNLGSEDFVRPFVEEKMKVFPNLFREVPGEATLFDTKQREKTSLLSQIAEVYFAVTGGAFQYFYGDRDERIKGVDQPRLMLDEGMRIAAKTDELKEISTLDEFLSLVEEKEKVGICLDYFRSDWEKVVQLMETATPVARINDTTLYLFIGDRLPLIPMIGGIVLAEKVRKNADGDGVILMVNREGAGTHFSLRGTGTKVHVGRICDLTASHLVSLHGHPDQITGGGHPLAGECRTRKSGVPHLAALHEFIGLIREMSELAGRRASWSDDDTARAERMGIA